MAIVNHYKYTQAEEEEYEGPPLGICDACGAECYPVYRDEGIGRYEYWGAKGTHHDWQWVSPCCDAEVVEGGAAVLRNVVRVARKTLRNDIHAGTRYREVVTKSWRQGGPSWFTTSRKPC